MALLAEPPRARQTFGVGQLMESMLVNDCPYGCGAPGGTVNVVLDHVNPPSVVWRITEELPSRSFPIICGTASAPVTQQSLLDEQYRPDIAGSGTLAGNVRACHVTPPSLVVMTSDATAVGPKEQAFPTRGTPFAGHGEGFWIVTRSSAAQFDEFTQERSLGPVPPGLWGKVPRLQVAPLSFVDSTK